MRTTLFSQYESGSLQASFKHVPVLGQEDSNLVSAVPSLLFGHVVPAPRRLKISMGLGASDTARQEQQRQDQTKSQHHRSTRQKQQERLNER